MSALVQDNAGFSVMRDKYLLKRIVYVNSATHGYSEIEIDKHMALFGKNNRGKTASLAGLKLALYPEVSFTHCETKFKFVGKDGNYSKEDSYRFYFPSYQSYIITEIENPLGAFCMVLYKAKGEWEYGRMFIPVKYEAIRQLFWSAENNTFASNLEYKDIEKVLKSVGGIQVNSSEEIARLLFSGHQGTPEDKRFCLLPLIEGSSSSAIEAFKNLYQLAFDIGQTDKKTLPRAIATIIEMKRSRLEEKLSTELDDILSMYEELSKQKENLTKKENCEPRWNKLWAEYKSYFHHKDVLKKSGSEYKAAMENELESINSRLKTIGGELESCLASLNIAAGNNKSVSDKLSQETGALKQLSKRANEKRDKYNRAIDLIKQYPDYKTEKIVELLQEEHQKLQKKLDAYSSVEVSKASLVKNISDKNQLSTKREIIRKWLKDDVRGLLDEMDEISAGIIYSINQSFSDVSLSTDKHELHAVNDFVSHFEVKENALYYEHHKMAIPFTVYDREETRNIKQKEEQQLNNAIFDLEKSITELQQSIKSEDQREEKIRQYKKELDEVTVEIELLEQMKFNKQEMEDAEISINKSEEIVERLNDEKELLDAEVQKLSFAKNVLESDKQNFEPRKNDLDIWVSIVEKYSAQHSEYQTSESETLLLDKRISQIDISSWERQNDELNSARDILCRDTIEMLHVIEVMETEQSFTSIQNDLDLSRRINLLHQTFAELEERRKLYESAVISHNQRIDIQLQELKEAKRTLVQYVESLNKEVNDHKVSNLKEVRLNLIINARFEQLMNDLDKYNLMQNDLVDKQFYERLNTFCNEFFQGKNSKKRSLNLEMLIDAIQYQYKLEGADKFQSKSQSGGTTSTTTALILSILLNQISPDYVKVGIPIIVDEIGTLDGSNKMAAIDTIAEHGFAVFCATPVAEPAVMEGIGRWIVIDQFYVDKPQVANCNTLILPQFVQSFSGETIEQCA